uniref:Leucine rich repeat containing 20 n=1 Tax=Oryzias latipes TaxID=8090 RepID=A0A3B3IDC1_ORYLA
MAEAVANVVQRIYAVMEGDKDSLDLSNCQLTSFPEGVFQLLRGVSDNIHVISLANNEMKAISSKFFSTFTQLKEVDLQGNVLTKLPDNIAELQHLTAVNLANNSFSAFPDKLTEIATLERINLEGNRIAGKNALICPVVNSDVPKITSFSLFSCFSQQRYPWRNCPTWRR